MAGRDETATRGAWVLIFSCQSQPGGDCSLWTSQQWRDSRSASTARWEEFLLPPSPGPFTQVNTNINTNIIPISIYVISRPTSVTSKLFQLFPTSPLQPLRDKNFHLITSCKLRGGKFDILFCLSCRQTEEYLHRHWAGRENRGHSDHRERYTGDMAGGPLGPGRVHVCCQQWCGRVNFKNCQFEDKW